MNTLSFFRKSLFGLVMFLICGQSVRGQNIELSNRLLEKYMKEKNQLKSARTNSADFLWLTPLIAEAKQNWDKLTDSTKSIFVKLAERPKFVGTEKIATYGNFAFHYSTDGPVNESVDKTDNDKSGVPDYIESMAHILGDSINSQYHKTSKLAVPPFDSEQVNGAYYDVYIGGDKADLLGEGTYGYVTPEKSVGDNPNTVQLKETKSTTSFMVMRNNYSGFDQTEQKAISVTASHEYMHAIHFGYSYEMDTWFMEATAAWAEEFAFPGYDDNFQYLSTVFSSPDVALNYDDLENPTSSENDGHYYGTWIFIKYLTEHTSTDIVKQIYEECLTNSSIKSMDKVLRNDWNTSFNLIFLHYVIANSLLGTNNKFAPYTYSRAADYLKMIESYHLKKYEGVINYLGEPKTFSSLADGNGILMRLGYDNFKMTSDRNFKIEFTPATANEEADILLIKHSNKNGTALQIPTYSGNTSIINVDDNANWDLYIPVIFRIDSEEKSTNSINYSLTITKPTITSNSELSTLNKIISYPNPATDKIYFRSDIESDRKMMGQLIDLSGKIVIQNLVRNNSYIDVSNMNKGLYFLKVRNEAGEIYSVTQIIQ